MAKNTQLAFNAPLVDCVEPSARYPLGISGPGAGIFGGAVGYWTEEGGHAPPPEPGEPDAIDRLAVIGADVTTMYDFTLARFLRDRGMDPEPEHPVWLPVEDRDWYTLTTMRLMALAFSDEPEWRERWRP